METSSLTPPLLVHDGTSPSHASLSNNNILLPSLLAVMASVISARVCPTGGGLLPPAYAMTQPTKAGEALLGIPQALSPHYSDLQSADYILQGDPECMPSHDQVYGRLDKSSKSG